jgi:hypothetical protein
MVRRKQEMPFRPTSEDWLRELADAGKSAHTLDCYARDLQGVAEATGHRDTRSFDFARSGRHRRDQRRPSGRVIPRPGRRRSAGAIYGPRSGDHQHIDSTSAQPDLCPVPRCDRKWRSSVAHRTSTLTISTFATGSVARIDLSAPFRFWIVAFDNASTVVLGLFLLCADAGFSARRNRHSEVGGAVTMTAGATPAGAFYTPNRTTVTSKAYQYPRLSRIRRWPCNGWHLCDGADQRSAVRPGVKKPGAIVQTAYASNTESTTATTNTQVQTGTTKTITPTSTISLIRVTAGQHAIAQPSRGTGPTLIGTLTEWFSMGGNTYCPASLMVLDSPATASAVTYMLSAAPTVAATVSGTQRSRDAAGDDLDRRDSGMTAA